MLKREYYVIKLGRPANSSKATVVPAAFSQVAEPVNALRAAPARAQRERDAFAAPLALDPVPAHQSNAFGFQPLEDRNLPVYCFSDEKVAKEYAKELAGKTPGALFGVFSCTDVFETTTPTIITKKFSETGELVVINSTGEL